MSDLVRLVLNRGREKAITNRHPWVFSGSIASGGETASRGALAELVDHQGHRLALGYVNPGSQIRFRALSFDPAVTAIDAALVRARIAVAQSQRQSALLGEVDAYRVVHGEGDGLPGLIVDRFADHLVVQFNTAGMELMREWVLDALIAEIAPRGIWERSQGPARRAEGLGEVSGLARGEEPPTELTIREHGVKYAVDLRHGQKTGFYLDLREVREWVRKAASGRRVLDVFAYSGATSVAAALGGASEITAVDSSAPGLHLLPRHLELNSLPPDRVTAVVADAFTHLREDTRSFDLIVLDPPPFARRKNDVDAACRGYKDLNLCALKRLAPGGILVTSSCSHHIDWKLFQQVVFAAFKDAGAGGRVIARLGHPPDHPFSIYHPEGEYLKTFVLARE